MQPGLGNLKRSHGGAPACLSAALPYTGAAPTAGMLLCGRAVAVRRSACCWWRLVSSCPAAAHFLPLLRSHSHTIERAGLPPAFGGLGRARGGVVPARGLATLPTNRDIRSSVVQLVDEEGTNLGALPLDEALQIGEERGLDVVQVDAKADPPVCRLKDMEKFEQVSKQRARDVMKQKNKQKSSSKKVRLSPRTDDGSLQVKANQIAGFLRKGMVVQVRPMRAAICR